MGKKRGLITAIIFVVILLGIIFFLFMNKSSESSPISGMFSLKIPENLDTSNVSTWMYIGGGVLIGLVIIGLIILVFRLIFKKKKNEEKKIEIPQININNDEANTDLDTLYNLLKIKKTLNTRSISKAFNISSEKALEWAKILENHELVRIEYPTFSPPEVKIIEREVDKK